MAKNKKATALPDNVIVMLAEQDKRNNFPPGTMQALVSQEVGGNFGSYLENPEKYHYGLNSEGKRIAAHTGKVSTAFGPLGLLESTAKNPGYGVKPLQNKSLEEQFRFAADYLAGRTKSAGGDLRAGLAGYGEGPAYADQVLGRINGKGTPARQVAPTVDVAAQGQLAEPRATPVPPSLWNGAAITGGAPQPPNPVSMAAYGQAPSEPLPVEAPVVEPVMAAPVPSTPINYGLVNPQAAQQPMAQEQSIPTQKYDPMQALLALLTEPEQQPQQNFGGMGAWA